MSAGASLPASPAPAYQYASMPGADTGAYTGIGQINTNPSTAYNAPASTSAGSALTQAGQAVLPYAQQTLQTGFDPQQALFKQQFQQQQDQANATNAQNGVAGTPYGAGLVNQGNQNFDINWQNTQLGRQGQAASTANSLIGAGSTGASSGTSIGQSVPGFSNQQLQQAISDYLAYLGGGTSASNAATGQYSAEANAAIQNQGLSNSAFGGIGQLGGQLLAGPSGLLGML